MLKLLRKQALVKKTIFWFIIAVMILAFVLWGAGAYREGSITAGYAGKISARTVSITEFRKTYLSCLNDTRLRFGENYRLLIPYLNLRQQAWVRLILLEYARNLKIKATNKEVAKEITAMALFFRDGVFNQGTYERIVRYFLNSQPRDFEEHIRKSLIIKKLYEQITLNITVHDEEVLADYKRKNETTSIHYLKVGQNDFLPAAQAKVTDEELKNYYQADTAQFKRPPPVKVEYIAMEYPEDAAESEKEGIFEEIKKLYPKIKNAQDLKTIAQGSIIHKETGFFSFGEPIEGIESEEFKRYAFSLREKETSPLIKTKDGVYVLRVMQKKDSYIADFDEVKEKIREILKSRKAKDQAKKKIEELKNKIDEALKKEPDLTLKEIGPRFAVEVKTTPQFKRFEPTSEADITQEVQAYAFELKPGQISGIIETPAAYFLIEQDKWTAIDEEKFKTEKETHQKTLLEEKKQLAFNNFGQELIAKSNLKDNSHSLNLPE